MSREQSDAIVVGSGLGGLGCAAYLSAAGKRTLVLEAHYVAGGNSQVFRRRHHGRGYEFDVGPPDSEQSTMVEAKAQTKPATTSETKAESKPAPKPEATKKPATKSSLKWVLLLVALAAAGFLGYQYWQKLQTALPHGIASGNGRLEAKLVDACAKEPLRVKEILVDEGSLVRPGQVLVRLDTVTLDAQLAEAKASVAAAQEQVAVANAAIVRVKSEIKLAKIEAERVGRLVPFGAASQRELDLRSTKVETTTAGLAEEEARLAAANQQVEVAQAQVATIRTRIADATLVSPVTGRVLYRLAEPGEVLGPGGKALTIVNLEDVYMEIFLPAEQAASLRIGAEARITVDHEPGREVAAFVSFVSPEAQFTPKEVETKTEREKLMFRVKIQVPKELVVDYIERVKTGVRGVGYVKYNDSASWPQWLDDNLLTAARGNSRPGEPARERR